MFNLSKDDIRVFTVMIILIWGMLAWGIYNDRLPTPQQKVKHSGLKLRKDLRPYTLAASYHTQSDPITSTSNGL
jgi:hypothetical protein